MLSGKMLKKLNDQINKETYSAYLYLAMQSYASSVGLEGVASWFKVQVREELDHAGKIYDYVNQQGSKVELDAIDRPPQEFSSAKELFEKTLEHEKKVTSLIDECMQVAKKENDSATEIFLQWFVTEQVEEEDNASGILRKFELAGKDSSGIFMIDNELGKRADSSQNNE